MDILDKVAMAFGTAPAVNTAPPVDKAVEVAPPPPPPPPDTVAPPVANTAPPPPPVGLPPAGEPDPHSQARTLLRHAMDTGDTDELARFLRELRRNNAVLARRLGEALQAELYDAYYNKQSISRDRVMAINPALAEAFVDPTTLGNGQQGIA